MANLAINNRRKLGVFAIAMINIIAVDSLRSLSFSATYGSSLVFYYLLAGISFFMPVALVAAELATAWPNRGGIYVWVREAFGKDWGFFIIWIQWIYNIVWYPTVMSFIAGAIAYLIDPALADNKIYILATTLLIFWLATLSNFWGMRLASLISAIGAIIGTLLPMAFIIGLGILWLLQGKPLQINVTAFFPDLSNVNDLAFLTVILFGLVGMEMSAAHADEVHDPAHTYPQAMLYSGIIIFLSLIFASLAIAIVVPHDSLNIVTGLIQAFTIFFSAYHMPWMGIVVTFLIIIGSISGVAAWIIGPTKGLFAAVEDGIAPSYLGKINRHGVPVTILLIQGFLVTGLCMLFLLLPTVSSFYWLLSDMTAQLALISYIGLFLAALYLRYKNPQRPGAYKIPGGNWGIWLIASMGIGACLVTIALGFLPPSGIALGSVFKYEVILSLGMVSFLIPPVINCLINKKSRYKS